MRQLREEEDALLLAAVQAMAELWAQLQEVRRLQGGRHLTDVAFSVVQLPPSPGEEAPLQAVSAAVGLGLRLSCATTSSDSTCTRACTSQWITSLCATRPCCLLQQPCLSHSACALDMYASAACVA